MTPILVSAVMGVVLGFGGLMLLMIIVEIGGWIIDTGQKLGLIEVEDPTCFTTESYPIKIELENGRFTTVGFREVPNANHPKNANQEK